LKLSFEGLLMMRLLNNMRSFVARFRQKNRARRTAGWSGEQPLRAELFSIDQLRDHAARLAGWHRIDPERRRDPLLPRLAENRRVLLETYDVVSAAAKAHRPVTPAGEWLVDNYYLIEEQIRTTQRHLPRSYSRELPHLAKGPLAGYPRVYDIAQELIAHLDGRVDAESLSVFVEAYQVSTPLTLGELWAIPIMLRLALIENLRRVATRIAAGRADSDIANAWADRIAGTAEEDPKNVILVLADMARANPPSSSAFIAEFARRLQGQGSSLVFVTTWIEQRLSELGRTIEQLVQ
jgi:cyclic beta-1,2-glucan synthetase